MNICKQCVKILNYDVKSYFFPTRPCLASLVDELEEVRARMSWALRGWERGETPLPPCLSQRKDTRV